MQDIKVYLKEEVCKLEIIVKQAQHRMRSAPHGALRIVKKNYGVEYYLKADGVRYDQGKYIKKKDVEIAYKLAQRDYDAQIIKLAEERIRLINRFIEVYEKTELGTALQKTNIYRRALLKDVILSDRDYIKQWQAVEYKGKLFAEDMPEIFTERGERVRSKSEKIIADKLYALGIPYRYEYPLTLAGDIKLYPDFTILRMPARKEVYLEHFGMMDDSSYVDKVRFKLNTYEKNGIYLGVNLFITYETSRNPLNTKVLNRFIRKLFCVE